MMVITPFFYIYGARTSNKLPAFKLAVLERQREGWRTSWLHLNAGEKV